MRNLCFAVVIGFAGGQRDRRPDEALPPGLQRWLGQDECQNHQRWIDFYHSFSSAIQQAQNGNIISEEMQAELQNGTIPERTSA